jgi:hypothetical protein
MTIEEKLKILETRYDVILFPYQQRMLLNWLNMTEEERDEDVINKVRNFYACRRPISLRDYWPVSLYSNSYYGTTAITNSNANAEAIKINQRRHAKGLRWSVEMK